MSKSVKKIIYYGDNSEQYGQLIKPINPDNVATPVVIIIHGGYWKDNHDVNSYATSAIVDYLTSFNVAVWNLEYRRMEAFGINNKAPWPTIYQDTANGIDHLVRIAKSEKLDLTRVLIIGHSAGGHLAVWAGCRDKIAEKSTLFNAKALKIHSVLSIAGILNLSCSDDIDQPEQVQRLMGGTYQQYPDRYQACDPNLLHSTSVNVTIMHGCKDSCVNISQAKSYCANTENNVEEVFIAEADHFSMLPHQGDWQEEQWQLLQTKIADKLSALD